MTVDQERLYHERIAADDAWQTELERVYGEAAGNARYDRRGVATTRLRELRDHCRQLQYGPSQPAQRADQLEGR
jgi:hypothetical protein